MKICPECGIRQPDNNRTCLKCRAYLPSSTKTDMKESFNGFDFDSKKSSDNTFMQDRIREKYGDHHSKKESSSVGSVVICIVCLIIAAIMAYSAVESMLK